MMKVQGKIASSLVIGGLAIGSLAIAQPAKSQARRYAYISPTITHTTVGLWGSSSAVYKESAGTYSGGALRARTPTHGWKEIPVTDLTYYWTY